MSTTPNKRTVRFTLLITPELAEALRVAAFENRTRPGPLAAQWLEDRAKTEVPKEMTR